ncbi:AraC family ligand binding domain-containing protein, partial [Paenibacillus sepulcri]|nr:AraC family ligand binding domain-containing protein [Paenibacillus sepulcri]
LVLVITGSMTVSIDGRPYAVPAGHTALLKPNHHEAFQFDTHRNTLHLWINVSPDGLPPSLLDGFNALPLALPLSDEMNRLAELMLALQRSGSAPEADVIRTLGWAAMQLFLEEHRRISANVRKHPSVLVTKDEIRIR